MGVLTLALLGGVVALDETSVGQFMVSRPLVAGTLAGVALGIPSTGVALGGILELLYLAHFHVGGARFPEAAPAAFTAVAAAAASPTAGGLALGLVAGLAIGALGGRSITALRHLNARFVPDPLTAPVREGEVWRAHLGGLALDFGRAVLLTLAGVLVAPPLVARLAVDWPLASGVTVALLLAGATLPLGVLWRGLSGARRRKAVFAAGLSVGLLAGVVL